MIAVHLSKIISLLPFLLVKVVKTSTPGGRPAVEVVKALNKSIVSRISEKYPDQKLIHLSHHLNYIKRPRSQLPNPVSGKDRFDALMDFYVIMENGIYRKRLSRR